MPSHPKRKGSKKLHKKTKRGPKAHYKGDTGFALRDRRRKFVSNYHGCV